MSDLTPKQARFVSEYLVSLNATQAAIRAGYSKAGASVRGSELLANRKVAEQIAAGTTKAAKRNEIDVDYVLDIIKKTIVACAKRKSKKDGGGLVHPASVLKGAELLGRHLAMFTDKVVADVTHGLQDMTDAELEAHVRRLSEKVGGTLPLRLITPTGRDR